MLDGEAAQRPGLVSALVAAGVDWLQLRERRLEGRDLLAVADALRKAAGGARLIVNRRCDIALAAAADGVHLGFDGVEAGVARELLGSDALIGVSTHAPGEIDGASGIGYAQLAPIHAPLSKPQERPPVGNDALREAAARGVPVIAQGGIDAGNARAAIEAGAAGVAVTGGILLADDPVRATRALRQALDA